MVPAPGRRHQELLLEIARQVADALEDHRGCRMYVAPFNARLPRADEAYENVDAVVQPDLSVVCDASKLDERGCRDAPDWIMQILSRATAAHDQIHEGAAYEPSGLAELWLVHPPDRIVTVYPHTGEGYVRPEAYELDGTLAPEVLPAVKIDWARVLREA